MVRDVASSKNAWFDGANWRGPLVLVGLVGLFFTPLVLHPGSTFYSESSDFLALHLPSARFQLRAMRETGETPYWCPWSFGGQPFQPIFEPFEFALFLLPEAILPETSLGNAVSWLVVGHCFLAAAGMWIYARAQGLGFAGSLSAALAYTFAGRTMLHLLAGGHYLPGLAWLPFILLCVERALEERSLSQATLAGVLFGILLLGCHPQWTFYSGILIGSWSLGPALREAGFLGGKGERTRRRTIVALARWLGYGAWVGMLGVGVGAVFILPMFSFATVTSRYTGVASEDMIALGRQVFLTLIGPPLQSNPAPAIWEERGAFGLILFVLAVLAPFLMRTATVRFRAGVCLFLFFLALGGALIFQWLPGLSMFRLPSRILLVASFPVAYLVGVSVNALCTMPRGDSEARRRAWQVACGVVVGAVLISGYWLRLLMGAGEMPEFHPYWLTLLVTLPLLFALLADRMNAYRAPLWVLLLLVDLWGICWPYLAVRPEAEVFAPSDSVRYLAEVRSNGGRVLDGDSDQGRMCSPLGRGAPQAMLHDLAAVRGYSTLDILRYKEYLNFIGDRDQTLLALRDDLTFPVLRDIPLKNRNLIDLLGVRYLLLPADQLPPGEGWQLKIEDAAPRAYDFVGNGLKRLPAYRIHENERVLPRAFVVGRAEPLPDSSEILERLKAASFRQTVFLEGASLELLGRLSGPSPANDRSVVVTGYQPHRVTLAVEKGMPGILVLTDAWLRGWSCSVNGEKKEVHRANYLFRAVEIPADACEVVFSFQPPMAHLGKWLSIGSLMLALAILAFARFAVSHPSPKRERE